MCAMSEADMIEIVKRAKKVAVVTGASRGIGLELALLLVEANYLVYNLSRTEVQLKLVPSEKLELAKKVQSVACDVAKSEEVDLAIKQIFELNKRIDLVVSNAGYGIAGSIEACDLTDLDQQLMVNLHGAFYLAKSSLAALRAAKGRIIFVSSVAGAIPIPFQTAYSVSKAGLLSLALALDNELKGTGARALVIMPGDVKSTFTEHRTCTAKDSEAACYKERLQASLRRMEQDEQNGKPASHVAQAIFNLSQATKPKVLTAVDFKYKFFVCLFRFLPIELANKIIAHLYA